MSEFTFDQIEREYGRREIDLALPRHSNVDWGTSPDANYWRQQMISADRIRVSPELLLKGFLLAYPDFEITIIDIRRAEHMKLVVNKDDRTDSFTARVEDSYTPVTFKGKPIEWEKF